MIARLNLRTLFVVCATLLAASAFAWPLFATALPTQAQAAVPVVIFALVPSLLVVISLLLDGAVSSSKTLALLGLLAAVGAAVRIASTGVGGFEAVFIILILGGRAYGARFGFLLGMLTIALSSILWGGFGPWTAFQMFSSGWVGAGAGLLPGKVTGTADKYARRREITWLIAYGILASYLFGALMNLWFWPFGVGPETTISYLPQGTLPENLGRFGIYTLVTSTLTWDTVRALTTGIGLALIGVPALKALRRAKL